MITAEDTEKYNICSKLLSEEKYKEALDLAESISFPGFRGAIFIDGGQAIGQSGKVREGTELFEDLLLSGEVGQHFERYSLLYNAANGHSSIYKLRRIRRKSTIPTNDDDLRKAKKLYRETLKAIGKESGPFVSQVLVNYGNCLSQFGRYIEAIECYQKALEADPNNGMAAGNLAIELYQAARLTGHYRHEYVAVAHELLTSALGSEMHLTFGTMEAVQNFQSLLTRLEQFIEAHEEPILSPEPIDIDEGDVRFQNDYANFCFENGLILNPWVGSKELSPSVTDDIAFGPIVTEVRDSYLVPELLKILNEIKESFSTARYLYFMSQRQSDLIDNISGMTLYFGIDSFEIKGLYIGVSKTAYARAFDVLDKVARIVNVYFKIGKREASFWTIFAEKQSLGEEHVIRFATRQAICDINNSSLYALSDLCIDYFESEHVDLKTIDSRRNRITHDYLEVKHHALEEEIENNINIIELDELYDQTKKVLLLAKYAILYVVSAVSIEERKKQSDDAGGTLSIEYESKPGQSFL